MPPAGQFPETFAGFRTRPVCPLLARNCARPAAALRDVRPRLAADGALSIRRAGADDVDFKRALALEAAVEGRCEPAVRA